MHRPRRRVASTAAAAVVAASILGSGVTSAATRIGWVGTTPPGAAGQLYLTTSTIDNDPLEASSRIYTTFGNQVASGYMGVQARLYKSGVLCEITDYRYNSAPANQVTNNTWGDCGPGSYNSHGYVKYWTGTDYGDFITFGSPALTYPASVYSATPAPARGTNQRGQTYGSAEGARSDADAPDLVAAIGDGREVGYVKKEDLAGAMPHTPAKAAVHRGAKRSVALYKQDGVTKIGTFTIN